VYALKEHIKTELNIEGNCREAKFVELVLATKPAQVTLVPDEPGQITSNHGWDTVKNKEYLIEMCALFREAGIRVSIFVDPNPSMVEHAAATGTDRIELYTEAYANEYLKNPAQAVLPYQKSVQIANQLGLGINAGHDLDRNNLKYFKDHVPGLLEVSIGHALISDALYLGLEETIRQYLSCLKD
jgi:pyridoxine 5-phosphate synthase